MIFSYDLNIRLFLLRKKFCEELRRFEILKDSQSFSVRSMNFVEVCNCCGNMSCIRSFGMKNKIMY